MPNKTTDTARRGPSSCSVKQKKLLVTASTFPRWEGDTEPGFVLDLASHLADRFEVTVLVPSAPGAKEEEVIEGIRIIRYHYFPIHKWETLCYPGAIVPRIKEKKGRALLVPFLFISLYIQLYKRLPQFDIVHAHWLIPQGIVQSFFKKPYIVTGHGGDVTSLNRGILRSLKKRCLKNARQVTAVSEYLQTKIDELVPDLPTSVISMGVNCKEFGPHNRIENYFGQGERKVILFVGRLAEKKGVTYLIEAMRYIDGLLIIVGDGPLRGELMEQAETMREKVRFLGALNRRKLKNIYASADIFAAPSIKAADGDQEGLPTTILEAMASGIPVVTSNYGGMKEIITSRVNGILCEEKSVFQIMQALEDLCTDTALYQNIVKNASGTVKKYDYEAIADKYETLIRQSYS